MCDKLQAFLTPDPDGAKWSASCSGHFILNEKYPSEQEAGWTHWIN